MLSLSPEDPVELARVVVEQVRSDLGDWKCALAPGASKSVTLIPLAALAHAAEVFERILPECRGGNEYIARTLARHALETLIAGLLIARTGMPAVELLTSHDYYRVLQQAARVDAYNARVGAEHADARKRRPKLERIIEHRPELGFDDELIRIDAKFLLERVDPAAWQHSLEQFEAIGLDGPEPMKFEQLVREAMRVAADAEGGADHQTFVTTAGVYDIAYRTLSNMGAHGSSTFILSDYMDASGQFLKVRSTPESNEMAHGFLYLLTGLAAQLAVVVFEDLGVDASRYLELLDVIVGRHGANPTTDGR